MNAFYFVKPIGTATSTPPLTMTARTPIAWTRWRTHRLFA